MKILQYITQSRIYYALLMAMAVSLPLSKAFMSIFTGCLMLNWLIEGQFAAKLQRLKERKSVLIIISVFLVYLIGLLWTNSMQWGMHDVKIQLPLLILPLVIGTSETLTEIQVKRIIYAFSVAVIVASLCSIFVLLGFSGKSIQDPREMSLFISHIRFSLLINISIFSLFWFALKAEKESILEKTFLFLAMLWLTIFLVILKSATGWIVFLIVSSVIIFQNILSIKNTGGRVLLLSILL